LGRAEEWEKVFEFKSRFLSSNQIGLNISKLNLN
jgi:hypothetical protein